MSEKLNSVQNGQIGVVAALLEGIILQPTLYWKNARALNLPFTLNPKIIYRGTLASCLNECQLLGFQFSATGFFNKTLSDNDNIKNVQITELVSAAMAGIVSTLLTCPIELVMIQQQHFGGSFANTSWKVLSQYGMTARGGFRGLIPTIGRETISVVGMLGITPIVQDYLMAEHNVSQSKSGLLASLVGGLFAAVPSHPFDVVKTCMQQDIKQNKYTTFSNTVNILYKEGGMRSLFNGCFWRSFNIVATVYIANECRVRLPHLLFHRDDYTSTHGHNYIHNKSGSSSNSSSSSGRQS